MAESNTPPVAAPVLETQEFFKAAFLFYRGFRGVIYADAGGTCTFAFPDTPELRDALAQLESGAALVAPARWERVKRQVRDGMDSERRRVRDEAIAGADWESLARDTLARERERARAVRAAPNAYASLQRARLEAAAAESHARLAAISRAQVRGRPQAAEDDGDGEDSKAGEA